MANYKNHTKYAVGVDLGGTNLRASVISLNGKIVSQVVIPTFAEQGKKVVLKRLIKAISLAIKRSQKKEILGIALGCPGPLDIKNGIIHTMPNLKGWENTPIVKIIKPYFKIPVFLDNDANLASLGEFWLGAAQKAHSLLMITLGTGIGGGFILEGKIWHGVSGSGGEFGHQTYFHEGLICNCGNHGCLEAYASGTGIVTRTKAAVMVNKNSKILKLAKNNPNKITPKIVFEAAKKGDRLAKEILTKTGTILGIAIANVANLINPQYVVIGGGVMPILSIILPSIKKEVKRRAFEAAQRKLKIVPAKLGTQAGILGAARLAFYRLGYFPSTK